jgi:hypothetical protein
MGAGKHGRLTFSGAVCCPRLSLRSPEEMGGPEDRVKKGRKGEREGERTWPW